MLETPKTLNTKNSYIYSKKFKDITMDNQQVNLNIFLNINF